MKNLIKSQLLFAFVLVFAACGKEAVNADYEVIPLPQEITTEDAQGFKLTKRTKIFYSPDSEAQKKTAELLADYLYAATGFHLAITNQEEAKNVIILKTGLVDAKPESYRLSVNKDRIAIEGADEAGVFYGAQTLRKSIPANLEQGAPLLFPAVVINDYPRFAYRGMHLDVSRHFFPIEFVKKYIDLLALHNINRFHWHLSDDQGWRIEIKKYPELTEIGAMRDETVIGHKTGGYDGTPYGGFFTQEEAREVVEYARERHITVIPEIDLPGHMLAALTAYPELGCTGGPYKVATTWGVFDDVLCAGNEETYAFLEGVFEEIIDIFPSEYIHVGGDECPKKQWKKCPKCQTKIKHLGIKETDGHPAEFILQSYVISRIERYLNGQGRQIIGWDEILEGGLAPNATVMSWRGTQGGVAAAKQGHDAIMVPTSHMYFDYYPTLDRENEPLAFNGYVPLEKVYSFEPIPEELTEDERKHIIGTQANLWTEYVLSPEHAEYMVLPRMAALCEVQWTMPDSKDYERFLARLHQFALLYDRLGYAYGKHALVESDAVISEQ